MSKFIIWGQSLGRPECVYIKRWVLNFGIFSVRLHHWYHSDDQRNFHDHEWDFITIVLKGSYIDISPNQRDILRFGSIRFRRAEHKHTVLVNKGGCWSLLLTGPRRREWGFWIKNKFKKRNKYFFIFGHHPCE